VAGEEIKKQTPRRTTTSERCLFCGVALEAEEGARVIHLHPAFVGIAIDDETYLRLLVRRSEAGEVDVVALAHPPYGVVGDGPFRVPAVEHVEDVQTPAGLSSVFSHADLREDPEEVQPVILKAPDMDGRPLFWLGDPATGVEEEAVSRFRHPLWAFLAKEHQLANVRLAKVQSCYRHSALLEPDEERASAVIRGHETVTVAFADFHCFTRKCTVAHFVLLGYGGTFTELIVHLTSQQRFTVYGLRHRYLSLPMVEKLE